MHPVAVPGGDGQSDGVNSQVLLLSGNKKIPSTRQRIASFFKEWNEMMSSGSMECLFLNGTVVRGFGRGSKELDCPTANIDPLIVSRISTESSELLFGSSGTGIFFGFAQLIRSDVVHDSCGSDVHVHVNGTKEKEEESLDTNGILFPMSASFGYNPCYNNREKSLEVHLIHSQVIPDFYGSRLKVVLVSKLREECKFDSLDSLKVQIAADKRDTLKRIQDCASGFKEQIVDILEKVVPSDQDYLSCHSLQLT